jgi:hypothetical protein
MVEITIPGHELVVTFSRDGVVADCFYCTDGKLALVILMTSGEELQHGDVLSVERRRRPAVIEQGLG